MKLRVVYHKTDGDTTGRPAWDGTGAYIPLLSPVSPKVSCQFPTGQ